MATTRVTGDGQAPLPEEDPLAAGLRGRDELAAEVGNDNTLLRSCAERGPDQWWYWTPEWQAGERQIERDRAAGLSGPVFDSGDDFLDALQAHASPAADPSDRLS